MPTFDLPSDELLNALQEATRRHQHEHRCGAVTFNDGNGLRSLAVKRQASRALELGTALGYTACCLAAANHHMMVDTIERDPDHVRLARQNIRQIGLDGLIHVHQGDFARVLRTLNGDFDIAFFDGFAPTLDLIEQMRSLLRDDGVLVCANLSLAEKQGRKLLDDELARPGRWLAKGAIERGATLVFAKTS